MKQLNSQKQNVRRWLREAGRRRNAGLPWVPASARQDEKTRQTSAVQHCARGQRGLHS